MQTDLLHLVGILFPRAMAYNHEMIEWAFVYTWAAWIICRNKGRKSNMFPVHDTRDKGQWE
jgi:hypothetical protein